MAALDSVQPSHEQDPVCFDVVGGSLLYCYSLRVHIHNIGCPLGGQFIM